ncbi:glycosyltransferase [Pseudomethylobacillus aquaticus]|uniref:Glycosyltransferase n=1 Tax=Pseudomethylobacillus aquaticus TaxID=2676064 RepID=A0A3N0UYB5_9PROT|nr:glycosyltransferase [Pseudomethylobacillus aquaticus]ROH85546.1 glycosyltransferase [Pseudomethylobacillus aquaticus]
MRILFIHQNFPGQFKHLAPALAARGHQVHALTMRDIGTSLWQGVAILRYQPERGSSPEIHPWLVDLETKLIRAEACSKAAYAMKDQGYAPDLIIAHPGWGESLFLKQVWPHAKLMVYSEFYYRAQGSDVNFDPEFSLEDRTLDARMMIKNINNDLNLTQADLAISPTHWQADSHPPQFRHKISVIHDGIDTQKIVPNAAVSMSIRSSVRDEMIHLNAQSEVVTFVNRNLEPYRGYHVFMRALPALLKARPQARVLIVGGDETGYGAKPPEGQRWRDIFFNEIRPQLDQQALSRIHFLGKLPYDDFIALLQLSSVHVYLTYPFVLSWSLLEAMSAGCSIVASDTAPLREVLRQDDNGVLVDFFDSAALAANVAALLADPARRQHMGQAARKFAQAHYDLRTVCLPRQIALIESIQC